MNELNKSSRRMSPVFQVRFTGETLRRWMALYAESIRESEQLLTELDAAIGDADHGVNMRRGHERRGRETRHPGAGRSVRSTAADLDDPDVSVDGAAGPLYGAFFLQCSHASLHKSELGLPT